MIGTGSNPEKGLSHHSKPEDLWLEVQVLRDEIRDLKAKHAEAARKEASAGQQAGGQAAVLHKALRDKVLVLWGIDRIRCNQCSNVWTQGQPESHTKECLAAP
jgi:hypothetical protein